MKFGMKFYHKYNYTFLMKYFLKAWEFLLSFMFMVMKLRILKKQGNFSY